MLREIRIQNLGVIDDAVLELSAGLNVVTGETGAGKTMVVSGLGLLPGARADTALVRTGADQAVVEGHLDVTADHPAARRAAEAGADVDEGLILVRGVSAQGRSRAHAGGRAAPVGMLAELGEQLVAVHGQADQWRLRRPEQHRVLLDRFAGESATGTSEAYRGRYSELVAARQEVHRLRELARDRARQVDMLRAGLEEIETVDPQPDEEVELRIEEDRLAHADGLRLGAARAHAAVVGGDELTPDDGATVVDLVTAARSALSGLTDHDPALSELDRRLAEVSYLASDLGGDLAAYGTGIEVDPQRLAYVQERRAALTALMRKYGESAREVLAWGARAAAGLAELDGADDRLEDLRTRIDELTDEVAEHGSRLSAARQAAARELADRVTAELGHLAMGTASVQVTVTQREDPDGLVLADGRVVRYGPSGLDDVEILLAANPGSPARSVARAASGGQLSRVMLALEVVTASGDVPTFVFDEVDAGVGGAAALDVGARLAELARTAQVIVVTHLGEVAACADRHLVVHKSDDGQVTSSDVHVVRDEERVRELARMLGGVADSRAAMEHARELLTVRSPDRTAG